MHRPGLHDPGLPLSDTISYIPMSFWNNLPRPFFVLAPMEAVTDVVFRHVVAKAARPDVYFTEFTNATGWVHAGERAIGARLVKTDDESPIVAQIWGGEPGDMQALAAHCVELGFDGIDINMGCPAKSAIKSGGSALIRQPELAVAAIRAAKTAGLPVSVKTRLGYTYADEWREWLTTLLREDVVALTIHLRTKKEMSKVPAHHELIPDIIALRDEIAPNTLLIINGDIRDRAHGLELVAQYPGVDGVMIGRGVFQNPFCFANIDSHSAPDTLPESPLPSSPADTSLSSARRSLPAGPAGASAPKNFSSKMKTFLGATPRAVTRSEPLDASDRTSSGEGSAFPAEAWQERQLYQSAPSRPETEDGAGANNHSDKELRAKLELFYYHLDLFDHYQPITMRPYETLKRFYKIYIRDFDGASELRDTLMHTTSTDEARQAVRTHFGT